MNLNLPITGREQLLEGTWGRAEQLQIPDPPLGSETVTHWLLTAPHGHPLWSQYLLAAVRLRDNIPGFPPPKRQFPGATHELLVVALDPSHGPYDREVMARYAQTQGLPYLTPVNIAEQFTAVDDEMLTLAASASYGVVNGVLWPETADSPDAVRAGWRTALAKTLAHIRGEPHAP